MLRRLAPLLVALFASGASAAQGPEDRPVLLELFSSEGCSSCPPADAVLRKLDVEQRVGGARVIALEFHVDYWNQLGWTDPFSDPRWSERQRDYSRVFGRDGVYTPQLIVDGRDPFVGSDEARARKSIAAAAGHARVSVGLSRAGSDLAVHVEGSKAKLGLWLAVTERGLATTIPRGENAGLTVKHGPVVRALSRIGTFQGPAFDGKIPVPRGPWPSDRVNYVVFAQDDSTRTIFGANIL
jgi:hypothetical protein